MPESASTTTLAPPRRLPVPSLPGLRDLGGYLTRSGEIVAWRHVFRSGAPDGASEQDARAVWREVGPLVVVDLRADAEGAWGDSTPLVATCRRIPLLDAAIEPDPLSLPAPALPDVYLSVLRRAGARMTAVLEAIAGAVDPVIVCCGTGRDRSGLVAAVLLGALGVGDDDIARDYALRASDGLDARPETMRAVLGALRRDHGSVLGYALDSGLDVAAVDALRDRLLR
jgi:protein-tyrosine phosphatase